MNKINNYLSSHKWLIPPIAIVWLFGFLLTMNASDYFRWWCVFPIAVFWAVNVFGWFELFRKHINTNK